MSVRIATAVKLAGIDRSAISELIGSGQICEDRAVCVYYRCLKRLFDGVGPNRAASLRRDFIEFGKQVWRAMAAAFSAEFENVAASLQTRVSNSASQSRMGRGGVDPLRSSGFFRSPTAVAPANITLISVRAPNPQCPTDATARAHPPRPLRELPPENVPEACPRRSKMLHRTLHGFRP